MAKLIRVEGGNQEERVAHILSALMKGADLTTVNGFHILSYRGYTFEILQNDMDFMAEEGLIAFTPQRIEH